ncbi:MAG: hypothetical protein GF411_08495 [Candidatus Lokiarchaeota archaeon]|nr:hypothetical protein [Candidatus Lokiarchaeota archaeon]
MNEQPENVKNGQSVGGQPASAGSLRRLVAGGWAISYDAGTCFVGGSHPQGGKFSLVQVHGYPHISHAEQERLGRVIAAALMEDANKEVSGGRSTSAGLTGYPNSNTEEPPCGL